MKFKYRPEIDGLRAIAVLSIMFYHIELPFYGKKFLSGGFFGVDIFFVISGYLITSILITEYETANKFSLINFYNRRARRILPVLFFVMLCFFPVAWSRLLPAQLIDYSKSILSSVAFLSNIYWNSILQEYGAESSLIKPFLHTWSLAVEEQFYLIFPLIMYLVFRFFKKYVIAILTVFLIMSFLFSEIITPHYPSFSFYMLPSRFWELLTGSIAAYFYISTHTVNKLCGFIMPPLGLALIIVAITLVDLNNNHPGFITILPVLGTVLIIFFSSKNNIVTKILSAKMFVCIGLLSYSFYIWHYPIFAFGRIISEVPRYSDKAEWVILTFVASIVTYFFLEKPLRNKIKVPNKIFIMLLFVSFSLITSVSCVFIANKGFDSRLGYLKSVLHNSSRIWVEQKGKKCHSGGGGRNPDFPLDESCIFKYNSAPKYVIAVGDSHAGSLAENLRLFAKQNSYNFIQLSSAGCQHIRGINKSGVCAQRSNNLLNYLNRYPDSIVVYSARIPLLLEMEGFVNNEGEKEAGYHPVKNKFKGSQFPMRSKAIIDTLNGIKKRCKKLVIVYPVPEQGYVVKNKLFNKKRLYTNKESLPVLSTNYDRFKERVKTSYQTLDKIVGNNIYRVYPENIFCREKTNKCIVSDKEKIYYAWDNHVSPLGSKLIVSKIASELNLKMDSITTK